MYAKKYVQKNRINIEYSTSVQSALQGRFVIGL
jgi:hypothetical protein